MTAEDTQKSDKPARASASGASRRRRIVALVLAAVVLAGLSWLAWWYFQARFLVSTSDAFIDAQIVPIAPQEPGRIVALPVETNSRVSGGAVVAQLDPATSEAELAQAKANVAKAETVIASAKANLEQARAAVARQTRAADVTAENARRQADRYRRIVATTENAAVSERQLDDAQAQARSSEAQAAEARTAIAESRAGVTAAEASLASAKADREVAEANLTTAEVRMDQMTITAPMDGEVVSRGVNVGSFVSAGTQMMALVPDDIYVTANFKETQLRGLRAGLPADIEVDAYPGAGFHGEVISIQKGAGQAFQLLPPQNATNNFVKIVQRVPVRISIEPDEGKAADYVLGPGMSAVPTVHLERP